MLAKKAFSLSKSSKNLMVLASLNKDKFRYYSDKAELSTVIEVLDNSKCYNKFLNLTDQKISCLLKNNNGLIKGSDVVHVVDNMFELNLSNKLKPEISQQQDYLEQVCNFIDNHKKLLNISESIRILKLLQQKKISNTSNIVSSILSHMCHVLDTASLKEYNLMYEIIIEIGKTFSTNTSVETLHRKFYERISDFDVNDLQFISDALTLAVRFQDKKIIAVIIVVLQKHRLENITISQNISLMKSFTYIYNLPSKYLDIIYKLQNHIIQNVDKMTQYHAITILDLLENTDQKYLFYNETLVDNCIEKAISANIRWEHALKMVNYCNYVCHINKRLLNVAYTKFFEEIVLKNNRNNHLRSSLFVLITGLAYAKHKPSVWKSLCQVVDTSMIALHNENTLLLSHHMACLENPCMTNYKGPEPPQPPRKKLKYLKKIKEEESLMLLSSLELALGGPLYVKTNLQTKLHHKIDYIVAFRDGGYPIALKNPERDSTSLEYITYVENLEIPSNCQIVAIMEIPKIWYTQNTHELLGKYSTYLETLEALSYKVIAISKEKWLEIPEKLRVPFLMSQIKSKLNYPPIQ